MPVSATASGSQTPTSRVIGKTLPLMNADQKKLPKSAKSKAKTKTLTTEAAEEHGGNGKPQPGAPQPQQAKTGPVGDPGAVPHEHRVG
jgi:hypothetical protein